MLGPPRGQDGFTLIELMVVVLIIGILVAIAIPVFNAASNNTRRSTCFANERELEGAAQQYLAANDRMWDLAGCVDGDATPNTADILVPQYLRTAPQCSETHLYYHMDAQGQVTGDRSGTGFTAGHAHY